MIVLTLLININKFDIYIVNEIKEVFLLVRKINK